MSGARPVPVRWAPVRALFLLSAGLFALLRKATALCPDFQGWFVAGNAHRSLREYFGELSSKNSKPLTWAQAA